MSEYIDWNSELQKVILLNFELEAVKNCIKNGADITIKDAFGRTVLTNAALKGKLAIIKYLIDEQNADIFIKDYDGNSILHIAAFNGHLEIVKYLVEEKKLRIHSLNNIGNTVLHDAVRGVRADIVKYLVNERKAKVNIKNYAGKPPFNGKSRITKKVIYLHDYRNDSTIPISRIKEVK